MSSAERRSTKLEQENVHDVYEQIAPHFSHTRYKAWPQIDAFLRSLPPGSLVADIGCGNGKYFNSVDSASFMLGSDRSENLVDICRGRGFEVAVCDNIKLPFRNASFDVVISIAVIHHFSTREHRLQALSELMRVLRHDGLALVYVWAFEQAEDSRKTFSEQDVLVPWQLQRRFRPPHDTAPLSDDHTLFRFYHVFRKGELEELVAGTERGAAIVAHGYDKENWWVRVRKTRPSALFQPAPEGGSDTSLGPDDPQTHR